MRFLERFKSQVPTEIELVDVKVFGHSDAPSTGKAAIKRWTNAESFRRGFTRSARICGIAFLVILPLGVMEPFLFMLWGSAAIGGIILIAGPVLHLRFWAESVSFFYIEARCPYCGTEGRLTPYLKTAFTNSFKALCPACGQTPTIQTT